MTRTLAILALLAAPLGCLHTQAWTPEQRAAAAAYLGTRPAYRVTVPLSVAPVYPFGPSGYTGTGLVVCQPVGQSVVCY